MSKFLYLFLLGFLISCSDASDSSTSNKLIGEHKIMIACIKNPAPKAVELQKKATKRFTEIIQKKRRTNRQEVLSLISTYEEAIKLEPKLIGSYLNLGSLYIASRNCAKALALDKAALTHCPKSGDLHHAYGVNLNTCGFYAESLKNYELATKYGFQRGASYYYNVGLSYSNLKKYDTAIDYYKKAIDNNKRHFKSYKNMIIMYYRNGNKKDALKYANLLMSLDKTGRFGRWARNVASKLQ